MIDPIHLQFMKKSFHYTETIHVDQESGGAYVVFPYDIRKEFGKGRIKVHATFDGIPYDGSIVNMGVKDENGEVCYVIGILKSIRKQLNKQDGDPIDVTIKERRDLKQIFDSENISFVEISELLAKDYLEMVNDYENVNRYIGGKHKTFTEEQEIDWVRSKKKEKPPVFSMIEKKSDEFIGNIELMDMHDAEAELGIAITGKMQDKGYGTEAIKALTEYGFDQLGLKRIFLRTNPRNARAIRVYEKCGFKEYKRDEKHIHMEIKCHDQQE